jgi:hypothetical protein
MRESVVRYVDVGVGDRLCGAPCTSEQSRPPTRGESPGGVEVLELYMARTRRRCEACCRGLPRPTCCTRNRHGTVVDSRWRSAWDGPRCRRASVSTERNRRQCCSLHTCGCRQWMSCKRSEKRRGEPSTCAFFAKKFLCPVFFSVIAHDQITQPCPSMCPTPRGCNRKARGGAKDREPSQV